MTALWCVEKTLLKFPATSTAHDTLCALPFLPFPLLPLTWCPPRVSTQMVKSRKEGMVDPDEFSFKGNTPHVYSDKDSSGADPRKRARLTYHFDVRISVVRPSRRNRLRKNSKESTTEGIVLIREKRNCREQGVVSITYNLRRAVSRPEVSKGSDACRKLFVRNEVMMRELHVFSSSWEPVLLGKTCISLSITKRVPAVRDSFEFFSNLLGELKRNPDTLSSLNQLRNECRVSHL